MMVVMMVMVMMMVMMEMMVVVDEVGSSPRQLALMETGANYDLMFSKKKMISHISLTACAI